MTVINNSQARASGPVFPILGILGLIFITLKLCGVITWSWWWVLAPFWGPFALIFAVLLIAAFVIAVIALVKAGIEKWRQRQKPQQ